MTVGDDDEEAPAAVLEDEDVPLPFDHQKLVETEVERQLEELRRRDARASRERVEAHARATTRLVCAISCFMVGVVLMVVGAAMVAAADGERLHGWREATCTILRNYDDDQKNTTEFENVCIFFSVVIAGNDNDMSFCAVPAGMASRGGFADPPACADLSARDELDVQYWRLTNGSRIECLVPTSGTIPAHRCIAAATTAGPGAALWRTWIDRFVYLVRDPREGTAALQAAVALQRNGGVALLACGSILLFLALLVAGIRHVRGMCSGWTSAHANVRAAYRDRKHQARKQY